MNYRGKRRGKKGAASEPVESRACALKEDDSALRAGERKKGRLFFNKKKGRSRRSKSRKSWLS